MREELILWEGPVAYVRRIRDDHYKIMVFSTNHVEHIVAGTTNDSARAESVCRRLNAYPRQTRKAFNLI